MLYPEGLALSSCKDGYIDMYIDRKVASTPCKMQIEQIDTLHSSSSGLGTMGQGISLFSMSTFWTFTFRGELESQQTHGKNSDQIKFTIALINQTLCLNLVFALTQQSNMCIVKGEHKKAIKIQINVIPHWIMVSKGLMRIFK